MKIAIELNGILIVGGAGLVVVVGGSLPVIDAWIETGHAPTIGQDADERNETLQLQAVLVHILRRPVTYNHFLQSKIQFKS